MNDHDDDGQAEAAPAAERPGVVELLENLERSVADARRARDRARGVDRPTPVDLPARSSKTMGRADAEAIAGMTRQEHRRGRRRARMSGRQARRLLLQARRQVKADG